MLKDIEQPIAIIVNTTVFLRLRGGDDWVLVFIYGAS